MSHSWTSVLVGRNHNLRLGTCFLGVHGFDDWESTESYTSLLVMAILKKWYSYPGISFICFALCLQDSWLFSNENCLTCSTSHGAGVLDFASYPSMSGCRGSETSWDCCARDCQCRFISFARPDSFGTSPHEYLINFMNSEFIDR